eukprot:gb/GECH01010630.1/.p1 GENE.gb/GECH01010630.1/~~gb/GECH01010630.1/.p1  ORF type:complete len:112 (+),score=28.40 gb/GECH01010630.1/:1-336(+)
MNNTENRVFKPRVNYKVLQNYVGMEVLLVGKVTSPPSNGMVIVETSDGESVHVYLNDEGPLAELVEFEAKVNPDSSLSEIKRTFIPEFDLETYNEAVELWNGQFRELFMEV